MPLFRLKVYIKEEKERSLRLIFFKKKGPYVSFFLMNKLYKLYVNF